MRAPSSAPMATSLRMASSARAKLGRLTPEPTAAPPGKVPRIVGGVGEPPAGSATESARWLNGHTLDQNAETSSCHRQPRAVRSGA